MGLRRTLAGGMAAVSASTLPFVLDLPGAAADEAVSEFRFFDHSFQSGGATVTCRVSGSSSLFRPTGDPTFEAFSGTSTFDPSGDQAPCDAFVVVQVTYTNPSGLARRSEADGENFVDLFNDDVASGYVATHRVSFLNCSDNCFVTFQTHPK
jgi:hypothetical protein